MSERSAIIRLALIVENLARQLSASADADGYLSLREVYDAEAEHAAAIRKGEFGP